jgi:hypothetical protein
MSKLLAAILILGMLLFSPFRGQFFKNLLKIKEKRKLEIFYIDI